MIKSVTFEQLLRQYNGSKGWIENKALLTKQYVPLEEIKGKRGISRN